MKFLDKTGLSLVWNKITEKLNLKVDKVDGKQLSTEDYTTAEKTKLSGIEEGANKTVIDTELSATSTNPVQNKVVDSSIAIKKYPASVDGYYYALMDSDTYPNMVTEGADTRGSVALGCKNTIGNKYTFVAGIGNIVSGNNTTAVGQQNIASGDISFVGGIRNIASGKYSTAIGSGNTASGTATSAIGYHNTASGNYTSAFGNRNMAIGGSSNVEGVTNISYGDASHAGGVCTAAIGQASVTYGGSYGLNIYLTGDANATTYTYTVDDKHESDVFSTFVVGNVLYLPISPYTSAYITATDTTNKTITLNTTLNETTALSGQQCWLSGNIAQGDYSFAMRGISKGLSS